MKRVHTRQTHKKRLMLPIPMVIAVNHYHFIGALFSAQDFRIVRLR